MANKNQNNNKPNNKSDNKNEDNPQFQWKKAGKTSFAWILIIIIAISLSRFFSTQPNGEVEIEYSDYKNFLSCRFLHRFNCNIIWSFHWCSFFIVC